MNPSVREFWFQSGPVKKQETLHSSRTEKIKDLRTTVMREPVYLIEATQQRLHNSTALGYVQSDQAVSTVMMEEPVCRIKHDIARVFEPLEEALSHGSYIHPGGYKDFHDNLQKLTKQYRTERGRGVMSEELLREYLDEKARVGNTILLVDQTLSKEEHKSEVERVKKEAAEQAQRAAEKQIQIQQQLMEKIEKEREITKQEYKQVLDAGLKELKDLTDKGFKEIGEYMEKNKNGVQSNDNPTPQNNVSKMLDGVGTICSFVPGVGTAIGGGLIASAKALDYASELVK
ncbi:guanylate-binding protein 1-like isoform X1 [Salvelinus fontinalis]|uniref:guanylate-binding protein 1-like isoform X1 n=2 Tax=Salvelinus fontinalis TaxID=8038 RepID=UPI0024856558|nr:guanylate-binding protein 1-like isoform X1 [Salvelinus fontinalis]